MNLLLKNSVRFFPVGDGVFHTYDRSTGRHFKLGAQEVDWIRQMDGRTETTELRRRIPQEYFDEFVGHVTRMELLEGVTRPKRFDPFRIKLTRFDPSFLTERLVAVTRAYRLALNVVTVPLAIFNLLVLAVEWQAVTHTLAGATPGWWALAFYLVATLITGAVHETSHALVARSFGIRTPAMGVMVMLLHPAFYADVSGISLLTDRRQRIDVLLAGVKANNLLAGLALAVCLTFPVAVFTPYLVLFAVMNLGLVLINLVPFVEFDGYFVFQELLGETRYTSRALQDALGPGRARADHAAYAAATLIFRMALICLAVVTVHGWLKRIWPSAAGDYLALGLLVAAYPLMMVRLLRKGA